MRRCSICSCKVKNCTCHQFAQTCKTRRTRDTLDEEGNCTCCPICGESKTKGRCSCGTTCQLSTVKCTCCLWCQRTSCDCCTQCQTIKSNCNCSPEIEMPENPPTMSVSTNLQEPPDISVLKDRSRLDYYITALKRWSGLAKATGTQDVFHADIVLDRAFRTYPELYMEMSDNFSDTLKDKG